MMTFDRLPCLTMTKTRDRGLIDFSTSDTEVHRLLTRLNIYRIDITLQKGIELKNLVRKTSDEVVRGVTHGEQNIDECLVRTSGDHYVLTWDHGIK